MRLRNIVLLGLSLVILIGCGGSMMLVIPNTLPYELQQITKTAQAKDITFNFRTHPKGDLILINLGPMWNSQYQINEPFRGMLLELLQTKFTNVTENSSNRLSVQIKDLQSIVVKGLQGGHTLKMAVSVEVQKDEDKNSKTLAYSFDARCPYGIPHANEIFRTRIEKNVRDMLLKFVVGIDKYLDSNRM